MDNNLIVLKSRAFALRIVRMYQYLTDIGERIMSKQLLRSGTSIGANISEGQYAQTKADFITKYTIALKEAAETRYWIDLLMESDFLPRTDSSMSVVADCDELLRLLASSVKTLKKV